MTMEERLLTIPKSYGDFVRYVMESIDEDSALTEIIEKQFARKPNSDVNDITALICDYKGIGEPLEIIDDEEMYRQVV